MGQKNPITTSFNLPDGREVTIETGKLAAQADGSVVVRVGKTMIFCSVVSKKEAKPDQPYFPLYVDYQENFAATGRIPGNFFRREGRPNEHEIIICRLVDRAIRPLFPENYMNETQVYINLISADEETMPDALAALAASAALSVSDIPFGGPISEVRVARFGGAWKVNPTKTETEASDIDVIVAANKDNIMMVEGEANECSEAELIEAIKVGHDAIKVQCQAQEDLAQKVGDKALNKRETIKIEENAEIRQLVKDNCRDKIYETAKAFKDKQVRREEFTNYLTELLEQLKEEKGDDYILEHAAQIEEYYNQLKKQVIREMVLNDKVRLDGRAYDEVRDIWTEVDYLPSTHGSAIFTRGETQSLTTLTLGTKKDAKMVDKAQELIYDDFMLHYNFPSFSVGEVGPMRGPGRREIGHGNLAGRSIKKVLPSELPYTIRIVSDIMESNGSSSMATVCAGSLALMDGGINIIQPVSGIAMGMIKEGDKVAVLSDILGDEDALGDMDFKVTGTKNGITACQMDIKIEGLDYDLMKQALDQAKEGRIHILNEMAKTLAEPREDLKAHAPRIKEIIIDKEFIGAVIGPGGKIIQDMQEKTGADINIEEVDDKGVIQISATNKESIDRALAMINEITFTPEVGDEYDAVVAKVMPYGVFVDFKGKSGLLHVSEISHSHIKNVEDVFDVGDAVKVKLIGIDQKSGKFRLSRKVLLPKEGEES